MVGDNACSVQPYSIFEYLYVENIVSETVITHVTHHLVMYFPDLLLLDRSIFPFDTRQVPVAKEIKFCALFLLFSV